MPADLGPPIPATDPAPGVAADGSLVGVAPAVTVEDAWPCPVPACPDSMPEGAAVAAQAHPQGSLQRVVERLAVRGGLPEAERRRLADAVATARWADAEQVLDALPPDGGTLADLIDRLVRGLESPGPRRTPAGRRERLQRVLAADRTDAARLQASLARLVACWQDEGVEDAQDAAADEWLAVVAPQPLAARDEGPPPCTADSLIGAAGLAVLGPWRRSTGALGHTLRGALPKDRAAAAAVAELPAQALADQLGEAIERLGDRDPSDDDAAAIEAMCAQVDRFLQHREHLVDQLGRLCHELTHSLGDLAEDDSWTRGQCDAMRGVLDEGLSTRGVRAVGELLRTTRERQASLRVERDRAREALKTLVQRMLGELGELGARTGRFHHSMERYTDVIEHADSLESLAGVVREMVEESRTVASMVDQTQSRLNAEHSRAQVLSDRVKQLECELRRLSAEVSTDQLTQVANRRGLITRFEAERARLHTGAVALTVGLLDIDNFKRLNDELGHSVGDVALKTLAQAVQQALRPNDTVARFGGEEFVVLMPATAADEGQRILNRVQRSLTGSLFMHEARPVFVTFSAGVTACRPGESLESALERADVALYEAKRTGKNRTCVA